MKPVKKKTCTACSEKFTPYLTTDRYCSYKCAIGRHREIELTKTVVTLIEIKDSHNVKHNKEFYKDKLKTRKDAAKRWCHAYIKARDIGSLCICCNRHLGSRYDSGHFLESGNNSTLRYHEDNIHSQSVHCNHHKGGDSGDYEKNLRLKIGNSRVDFLLANKGGTVKRTAQDYREIEDYYKLKLKELKNEHKA